MAYVILYLINNNISFDEIDKLRVPNHLGLDHKLMKRVQQSLNPKKPVNE